MHNIYRDDMACKTGPLLGDQLYFYDPDVVILSERKCYMLISDRV